MGTKPQFFSQAALYSSLISSTSCVEVLHVERAEGDALALPDELRAARSRSGSVVCRCPGTQQVLRLAKPARSTRRVVARVVRHHQRGRRLEAVDQEPALVVHEGDAAHAARRARGRAASRRPRRAALGDGLVVDALEEAEEADPVAVGLVVQAVVDGGDAADDAAVALGQEVLGLGVLEEGVSGGVEERRARPDATAGPRAGPARAAGRAEATNASRSERPATGTIRISLMPHLYTPTAAAPRGSRVVGKARPFC